jgi:hypothetical protein
MAYGLYQASGNGGWSSGICEDTWLAPRGAKVRHGIAGDDTGPGGEDVTQRAGEVTVQREGKRNRAVTANKESEWW